MFCISELKFKNYKYVVNVMLGEIKGAGVKIHTRCIWDAEADSYAHSNFKNVRTNNHSSCGIF